MHTLFQCNLCGKILFSQRNLDNHKEADHPVAGETTDDNENTNANAIEVEDMDDQLVEDLANEEESVNVIADDDKETELVWVKLASIYWPAKLIRKINGEISEIELFDETNTKKIVDHIKLKPFEKLDKIPARRNKHWKEAYSLALEKLQH